MLIFLVILQLQALSYFIFVPVHGGAAPIWVCYLCFASHLNIALLELNVLAHHYAYLIGFHDFFGHRGELEYYLFRLFLYLFLFLSDFLLHPVLFQLELFLGLKLRFLYLFLNLQELCLQFLNFNLVNFIRRLSRCLLLLLLQLLLGLQFNILDALFL